jgi:hypothetical protein
VARKGDAGADDCVEQNDRRSRGGATAKFYVGRSPGRGLDRLTSPRAQFHMHVPCLPGADCCVGIEPPVHAFVFLWI